MPLTPFTATEIRVGIDLNAEILANAANVLCGEATLIKETKLCLGQMAINDSVFDLMPGNPKYLGDLPC